MSDETIRRIVEAVAAAEDVQANELETCLHDYIDTEAIRLLADHSNAPWTLSFDLPEHQVTVSSEDIVVVDATGKAAWA